MKTSSPKRVTYNFNDTEALKMFHALWNDFEEHLPLAIYNYISGRVRAKDIDFIIASFPDAVLPLMQTELCHEDGTPAPKLNIGSREFSLGLDPKKTIQLLYTASCFLKKYPFESSEKYTDDFRRKTATRSLRKAEKFCRVTTNGFRQLQHQRGLVSDCKDDRTFIFECQRTLSWLLGSIPDYSSIIDGAYFGPGVNVGINGRETDIGVKFSKRLTCTAAVRAQLNAGADLMPGIYAHYGLQRYLESRDSDGAQMEEPPLHFYVKDVYTSKQAYKHRYERMIALGAMDLSYQRTQKVSGNKVTFVPKSAKTDRPIAVEPMVNSYLQNGVGTYLVKRLRGKTVALDCRDQTRNRQLAKLGSETNLLSTIDLSSASDTISMGLAHAILPKKWFDLLRLLRSPTYMLEGKVYKANKLSSMGNGFTFPIESALFYSVVRSAIVCDLVKNHNHTLADARLSVAPLGNSMGLYEPSVYGDDIIIDGKFDEAVFTAIKRCGFWPNREKSYTDGPFRESCGHDYHYGEYVRPLFLKEKIRWVVQVNTLVNQLLDPNGLGWLSTRYGISFRSFFKNLVNIHNATCKGSGNFGPWTGVSSPTYLSMPIELLRIRDHLYYIARSKGDEPFDQQRWGFNPLVIVQRKSKSVSEFGHMLKTYHRIQPDHEARYENSLATRIKRGEVTVKQLSKSAMKRSLATLPHIELASVPENFYEWLVNFARYKDLYPLLRGY